MAKKIPVRKKVAKKKPSSAVVEKFIKRELKDLDESVDERYAWAMKFLKRQDDVTREAVNRLVEKMEEMAGPPSAKIALPGDKTKTQINVDHSFQERTFIYIAVRLLIAGANVDVRVAKFKFPKRCAEPLCGRKVA